MIQNTWDARDIESPALLCWPLRTSLHLVSLHVLSHRLHPTFRSVSGDKTKGTAPSGAHMGVKSHGQEWILLYEQLIKRDKLLFAFYACLKNGA